ncbi:unnamed protein product, partial [Rotaria sp. Silwood1]
EPESNKPLVLLSFISHEYVESIKRSRSKLSSSTPLPNHCPHGNLFFEMKIKKTIVRKD